MTGDSKNEIVAAILADPKLQEAIVRLEKIQCFKELTRHYRPILNSRSMLPRCSRLSRSDDVASRRLDTAEALLIDSSLNFAHATLQAWVSN